MKKIITLSMIKNEADIVETFVRYTFSFAYKMVFINNGCNDGSLEILQALINEGFNIDIYDESGIYYEQFLLENKYHKFIAADESFDYLIPLDVDEFLTCDGNLLEELNGLNINKITSVYWFHYCMMDENEDGFFMDRIKHIRMKEGWRRTKVIIPYSLAVDKCFFWDAGHHSIVGIDEKERNIVESIYIAHFPVRSLAQIKQKIFISMIGQLMSSSSMVTGWHLIPLIDQIKKGEFNVVNYSKKYALDYDVEVNDDDFLEKKFDYSKCVCKDGQIIKYASLANKDLADIMFDVSEMVVLQSLLQQDRDDLRERIVIFGTGKTSKLLERYNIINKFNVVCYIDNDIRKQYSRLNGKLVLGTNILNRIKYDKIIIASQIYYNEILNQLVAIGIKSERIEDINYLIKKAWENI